MKKIFLIVLVTIIILFFVPYLFQRELNIKVANNYINSLRPEWDTVFVNFKNCRSQIDENSLDVRKNNSYVVKVFDEKSTTNENYNNATIIINTFQIGFYSKVDIEIFAWEGSRWHKETYVCLLFIWLPLDRELKGMA